MKRAPALSGFTLAELLIALVIATLILAGISSTFYSLVSAHRTVTSASDEDRVARVLTDRMRRELVACLREADTFLVIGRDHEDQDEIAFWTLAYGTPRKVSYGWNDGVFERCETDPTYIAEPDSVAVRSVARIGLRYRGSGTWLENWNDIVPPSAVSIDLYVGSNRYSTIVAL